ncbi:MAG: hypothetical protein LBG61_03785 [Burkholderiales bacterium]|jgi:mannose/fructose-specific phosphotransferase system component IIA|nr:hypothetical protein [Burkholderiales bacterium]
MLRNITFAIVFIAIALAMTACGGDAGNKDVTCVYCFSSDGTNTYYPTVEVNTVSYAAFDREFPQFNVKRFDEAYLTVIKDYNRQEAPLEEGNLLLADLSGGTRFNCVGNPLSTCEATEEHLSVTGLDYAVATFAYTASREINGIALLFSAPATSRESLNADETLTLAFGEIKTEPMAVSAVLTFPDSKNNLDQIKQYYQAAKKQFAVTECSEFTSMIDTFRGSTCDDTYRAYCEALEAGSAIIHTMELNKVFNQLLFIRGIQRVTIDEVPPDHEC